MESFALSRLFVPNQILGTPGLDQSIIVFFTDPAIVPDARPGSFESSDRGSSRHLTHPATG